MLTSSSVSRSAPTTRTASSLPDRFQMLPRDGYARVFETILDHKLIRVTLNEAFDKAMLPAYLHCFNSIGEGRVTFIGRCGTYQYLVMHQVINQSLAGGRAWVE